ncbi:MAG: hypothetical protein HKM89_08700 [Gemmatimonadales bacterium]|nr:hypothetical protein [Gemmatimonadales bacterium]
MNGALPEKADARLDPDALALASRVYAREAASKAAAEGQRWVIGAGGIAATELRTFEESLGAPAINGMQAGLVEDMDRLARKLYQEYET